jgi:hypothetical protein
MMRLSDLDVCTACCKRGADVRPDFHWNAKPIGGMDIAKGQRAERRPRGPRTDVNRRNRNETDREACRKRSADMVPWGY